MYIGENVDKHLEISDHEIELLRASNVSLYFLNRIQLTQLAEVNTTLRPHTLIIDSHAKQDNNLVV